MEPTSASCVKTIKDTTDKKLIGPTAARASICRNVVPVQEGNPVGNKHRFAIFENVMQMI